MRKKFMTALLACAAGAAYAGTVSYTISGTWGPGGPTGPLSAPNTAFSASFIINTPVATTFVGLDRFNTLVEVTYTLGALTTTYSNLEIGVSSGTLFLFAANQFAFNTAGPLFSGSTSDPTLSLGTFTTNQSGVTVDYGASGFSSGTATLDASVIPEPATAGTALFALGLLAAMRRKISPRSARIEVSDRVIGD